MVLKFKDSSRAMWRTLCWFLVGAVAGVISIEGGELEESPQGRSGPGKGGDLVYRDRIVPHWFADNTRFWYRNDLQDGAKEFILVHAERGTREAAFDHRKLAVSLSKATESGYEADRLPFETVEFIEDSKAVRFEVGEKVWRYDLSNGECTKTERGEVLKGTEDTVEEDRPERERRRRSQGRRRGGDEAERSPDGAWAAFILENNVFVRGEEGEREVQLSEDGEEGNAYGRLEWSPDSKVLAAFRIEPGDRKDVYLIRSSPSGGGRAELESRPYALPGDKFTVYELNLFDVAAGKRIRPEVERVDFGFPRLRWIGDGHRFTYEKVDRGHQRFRVIEVDSRTGRARHLIDEKADTFIWTAHTENLGLRRVNYLEGTEEMIYVSEQDGWRHLYLIDAAEGAVKKQVTQGEWVVRGIDLIDEEKRQLWFQASGMNKGQDPYFIHFYRVNFDGTGLVALTEGDGTHRIEYSPDRKYLIDHYSRVDMAPIHELRRVTDGKLVCELERADLTDLLAGGWEAPEVFVAKGRDGETDIWGIINLPREVDQDKKYPIIEDIYAGPQGSYVPKSFSVRDRYKSLTDQGFIVVKMDGMGTANRSKAFHDVCWKDLKDAGFPDRIGWIKEAAKKYPYMDLSRVGVYGTSAGGQNAAGAVLFHPEFYKVAVAACGCHDNRMDKASWNEQWMGYPVGPQYGESSNIDSAYRLEGKLFLMVGEMDNNVPPESTMRFVDALVKAGKDFDLLVLPGMGHGMGGAYGRRRMENFFVRHLLGVASGAVDP